MLQCMLAEHMNEGLGKNPGCSKVEPLERDGAGKAREDGIRGRESE